MVRGANPLRFFKVVALGDKDGLLYVRDKPGEPILSGFICYTEYLAVSIVLCLELNSAQISTTMSIVDARSPGISKTLTEVFGVCKGLSTSSEPELPSCQSCMTANQQPQRSAHTC